MDLTLRKLDRLAAGGDPEAQNRADRLRCRMGEHTWSDTWPYWVTGSGLYEYKFYSDPLICSVCGYEKKPFIFCGPPFDYASAEFKILDYADVDVWATTGNGFASTITTTSSTPFIEEEEDPRKGSPPPYTWHPTKKRPWQKPGYRKRIKARRKRCGK